MTRSSTEPSLGGPTEGAVPGRDDDDKPDALDSGLWAWSRHPNYFGDLALCDGVWITAAASPGGQRTLPALALISYLPIFATGAKCTEKRMESRVGYRDYQRRVDLFFPWVKGRR